MQRDARQSGQTRTVLLTDFTTHITDVTTRSAVCKEMLVCSDKLAAGGLGAAAAAAGGGDAAGVCAEEAAALNRAFIEH